MRKIPTLFVRDDNDRRYVISERNPDALWVGGGPAAATRKYDGTCLLLDDDGEWWARREVKPRKEYPANYMPVGTDAATGKTVGWEPVVQSPFVKFWREAVGNPHERRATGTYELVGPKVNGNPEKLDSHELVRHADAEILSDVPTDFDALRDYLSTFTGEGIVWHHPDGRMAKIKRRDFPSSS